MAGVRLVAGNYSVAPMPASAFHVYILCNLNRTAPFTVDLSNSTLVLTVRSTPATTCYVMPCRASGNMALTQNKACVMQRKSMVPSKSITTERANASSNTSQ